MRNSAEEIVCHNASHLWRVFRASSFVGNRDGPHPRIPLDGSRSWRGGRPYARRRLTGRTANCATPGPVLLGVPRLL